MNDDLKISWRNEWPLDPDVAFCNHGSFGACPTAVLASQSVLREELERDPVHFFRNRYEPLLDEARHRVAAFVGADLDGTVFVPNATTGVNTVLASWPLSPGDELLVTNHGYEACTLAAERIGAAQGVRVVIVDIRVPVHAPEAVTEAILAAVTPSTRLAIVDHVTSPTGLVLPIDAIVAALAERAVDVLVDGAHGPGQLPVDVHAIGAAAYTGNCHKWMCAPKGAGFLWLREDLRNDIAPLVTSHGERHRRPGRSHLHDRFDWTGTADPTSYLSVPAALDHVGGLHPDGWPGVYDRNRRLALVARSRLDAAGFAPVGPQSMVGTMTAALLPDRVDPSEARVEAVRRSAALYDEHRVSAPITWWRGSNRVAVRFSAHLHTSLDDVDRLVEALRG